MQIKGSVEEIRFRNEENGFSILVLDVEGDMVVAVGSFPPVGEGESLSLTGEFVTHPRFGRQFKSTRAERIAPTNQDAVFRFISSGIIKGIGPKTASVILGHFGDKSLEVLEKKPALLSRIKGISLKKAQEFSEEYKKHLHSQDTIMFLQDKGITINMALKIYKKYGQDTVAILSVNPYKLIDDILGIGFLTADRIAVACGIEPTSEFRVRAGVICALRESGEQNGNTFLYRDELAAAAAKLVNISDADLIENAINGLIVQSAVKVVNLGDKEAVFLRAAFSAESGAAVRLVNLEKSFEENGEGGEKTQGSQSEIEKSLDLYKQIYGIELNGEQREAVITAVKSGVCVITGGPGTGKTTIIKCLLNLFESRGEDYMLMAPTGRAAKRIFESTGVEASTIHRALKLPVLGVDNLPQLTVNNVIVDEVSMMDIYLFNTLLKCVRDGTRLILLGDKDQLPSVGAGNVLADVLEKMPRVVLKQIYRQAEKSLIVKNAHLINGGEMPKLDQKDKDFFFMPRDTAEEIAATITDLVGNRLPAFLGVDAEKIQVLCPMKNGAAGTVSLNEKLSAALNKGGGAAIEAGGFTFKAGDKIMQTSNNYSQPWERGAEKGEGVFNGDMGIIESVSVQAREICVLFEDGRRAVYSENIDELIQAYAITVHKSQGSEFEAIVMPVLSGSPAILTRNLLYTAVTRAKRLVVLVGQEYGIKRMVENDYIAGRYSGLKYFIDEAERNYQKLYGGRT